jgi:hypothetical protein
LDTRTLDSTPQNVLIRRQVLARSDVADEVKVVRRRVVELDLVRSSESLLDAGVGPEGCDGKGEGRREDVVFDLERGGEDCAGVWDVGRGGELEVKGVETFDEDSERRGEREKGKSQGNNLEGMSNVWVRAREGGQGTDLIDWIVLEKMIFLYVSRSRRSHWP